MTSITISGLTVVYPGTQAPAIENVNATFCTGRRIAIVGRNGAGKSTLIQAILGLIPKQSGAIRLGDGPLKPHHVAYVPQRSAVDWAYPITVRDVVMMGQPGLAAWLPFSTRETRAAAAKALAMLGLNGLETEPIGALSGGQQQRVFLARALMQKAQFYILDEPLTGLDVTTTQKIADIFADLAKSGAAVIAVHHDLSTVAEMFDDVIFINRQIVASGPVSDVLNKTAIEAAYAASLPLF